MAQTAAWANGHRTESAKILTAYTKVNVLPGTHRTLYRERLRAADLQPLIDISARYGLIDVSFPAGDLFAPLAER